MKKINELKERIYKHCPELKELSFGCEIRFDYDKKGLTRTIYWADKDNFEAIVNGDSEVFGKKERRFEILGHPIQLQHVLRAINKSSRGHYYFRADGVFFEWSDFATGGTGNHKVKSTYIEYDLTESFDQNCAKNPKLVDFLLEVIK